MKQLLLLLTLLGLSGELWGGVKLPGSMRLAGPLDASVSAFGDEFYNFPSYYGGRAIPGRTGLNGWVEFRFSPPVGNKADFTIWYNAVGGFDQIFFPGGQTYVLDRNRAFNNDWLASRGTLNLDTGDVTVEIHAGFRNTIIARVDKNQRIPFQFPNDYPPLELPVPYPFTDRPETPLNVKFTTDSNGNLTGFDFRAESMAPVTVLPGLGLFPPYCFGPGGQFYFATPTACLPGTPPQNCPNPTTFPDGVPLAKNAFFHPHFELVSTELREVPQIVTFPTALPVGTASPAGLVAASGRLYHIGGLDRTGPTNRVQVYDPTTSQWGVGAPIPTPVIAAQSAAVGTRIYVVGGWSVADGMPVNTVQVFDAVLNRWTKIQPAPLAVSNGGAASVGSKIFVIGGLTVNADGLTVPTEQVQILDTATGIWSSGSRMPSAAYGSGVVAVGPEIYVLNGLTADMEVTKNVFVYHTAMDLWRSGPSSLKGVYDAAAGYTGNRIYLVGGRLTANGITDSQLIQILDVPRQSWQNGHEQPLPTTASGAAVLNGKFYIVGGRTMVGVDSYPGDITDAVQRYDPELGWFPCNSRPLFASAKIMNAASGPVGPIDMAPGTRAVILGHNFASSAITAPEVAKDNGRLTTDLPVLLGGISITVDGKPAPIFYVDPGKIEFQIPYDIAVGSRNRRLVPLVLTKEGSPVQAPPVLIPLLAAAPGIYIYNYGDYTEPMYMDGASAVAKNANGTLNYPSQPAHPGESIYLPVTGLGLVDPALVNGQRAWDDVRSEAIFLPRVSIGGKDAKVISVALRPREAGIYDIQAVVPTDCPKANNVPVVVTVNLVESNKANISVW